MRRPLVFLAVATVLSACIATLRPLSLPPPMPAAGTAIGGPMLEESALRRLVRAPTRDVRQRLSIAVRDGRTGQGFEGRGVVAVRPATALRLVVLGPGGSTALDVWMRDGRYRVAVPALERIVRGDRNTPKAEQRGLPTQALWRLLVAPMEGALVAARGRSDLDGDGYCAWLSQGTTREVRCRRVAASGESALRVWWLAADSDRLRGFVEADEVRLAAEADAPLFPQRARYVELDPPLEVFVDGERPELVPTDEPLPEATFADPDAPPSP